MGALVVQPLPECMPDSPLGQAWEQLVLANPANGIMQSLHWASFKRRQGLRALHLGLFQGDCLIGGLLAYTLSRPGQASLLVAPEGPVLPWADANLSRAGLACLIDKAEELAPDYQAIGVRLEPRLAPPRPRLLRAFNRAPVDLLARETLYLDLTPEPATLLKAMRPKGRYNIRLADRHGVTVTADSSPAAARRLHGVLASVGARQAIFIEPLSYFDALLTALHPPGLVHCLFAERDGLTLGAMLLVVYGQRATYLYGGITGSERQTMAGYALQWSAMLRARQLGCTVYDLFGFEPAGDPTHLYAGFSRFKRQFGGQAIKFIGAHDYYFLEPLASAVIQAINECQAPPVDLSPWRLIDQSVESMPT